MQEVGQLGGTTLPPKLISWTKNHCIALLYSEEPGQLPKDIMMALNGSLAGGRLSTSVTSPDVKKSVEVHMQRSRSGRVCDKWLRIYLKIICKSVKRRTTCFGRWFRQQDREPLRDKPIRASSESRLTPTMLEMPTREDQPQAWWMYGTPCSSSVQSTIPLSTGESECCALAMDPADWSLIAFGGL